MQSQSSVTTFVIRAPQTSRPYKGAYKILVLEGEGILFYTTHQNISMRGSFLVVIALMKLFTAFFLTAMTINCCAYLLYLHMKDWLL